MLFIFKQINMKSKRREKIRLELKKNELKREKIHKIQKRITLLGVFGFLILITLLLFGYIKKPNQVIESSFTLKSSHQIHELINHPLFNELDREYLQKNIDDLDKIGIGGIIKDFYDELVKLESTLT